MYVCIIIIIIQELVLLEWKIQICCACFFLLFGFTIFQILIIAIYNINQNMKYYYCNSL